MGTLVVVSDSLEKEENEVEGERGGMYVPGGLISVATANALNSLYPSVYTYTPH